MVVKSSHVLIGGNDDQGPEYDVKPILLLEKNLITEVEIVYLTLVVGMKTIFGYAKCTTDCGLSRFIHLHFCIHMAVSLKHNTRLTRTEMNISLKQNTVSVA